MLASNARIDSVKLYLWFLSWKVKEFSSDLHSDFSYRCFHVAFDTLSPDIAYTD